MKDLRRIVRRPVVTEKTSDLRDEENQNVFEVAMDANKIEIARAVEEMFKVHVEKVRTIVVRGKLKRVGLMMGRRRSWKKAVITLAEGENIDVFEGV
ncbi:MAG: 50S ribosomal protein L23 [Deltaproteobacteria bacterium]|nr:50S ribosomal protein L23 [Deltaproteobacteria bacterium]